MIRIEHLSYSFGKQPILNDISLHVAQGSFTALLGPNGCGKTTLLRCIGGLLKPQSGTVILQDRDLRDYNPRQLAQQLSFVRQQASTDFEFTAFDLVMMGRNPYQKHLENESQSDRQLVEQCMRQTNTWHLRDSFPREMSGGELQRVMIARALAQSTPIMLLDEPTSNLDIAHQFDIMEMLSNICQRQGKTILLVVHDLNLALRYCPQAVLLHNYGIIAHGAIENVLTSNNIRTAFGIESEEVGGTLRFYR